jgi:hypothetical protein
VPKGGFERLSELGPVLDLRGDRAVRRGGLFTRDVEQFVGQFDRHRHGLTAW